MESSLFFLIESDPQVNEKLAWMLGEDAPIFADEVEEKFQPMFSVLEECHEADSLFLFNEGRHLLLTYLWGDWEEFVSEQFEKLKQAGADKVAVYVWADEVELFSTFIDSEMKTINPRSLKPSKEQKAAFKDKSLDQSETTIITKLALAVGWS
ncbi:hypothetical protein ACMXYQ_12395 [Neptuniibacter sp. PT34_22]|uniref:hypothetical protein n=1 Tax=Neptuniibacter sp. PT34_22 TaxID=3398205 RepID=UPI0039F5628C